jgi:hypothetical protein
MTTIPVYPSQKSHSKHRPQARKEYDRKPKRDFYRFIAKKAA